MDIFNMILCLQICNTRRQEGTALLDDTAACRLNIQGGKGRIIPYISVQVDIAAVCIGIGQVNGAVLLPQETDGDRIVRLQGEGVGLGGSRLSGPGRVILGIRP